MGCVGGWEAWFVELDVRDLSCHLDFTRRARAGTLSRRVQDAAQGVAVVGALLLRFQVKLGLVRGKYLPTGLHAVEASCVCVCFFPLCLSCCYCEVGLVQ